MKLHEFLGSHARGQGKTESLAKLVAALNGTLIVRSVQEANRVEELYKCKAKSVEANLAGMTLGITYVDPDACYFLVENETRPLKEKIKSLQSQIESLTAQNDILEIAIMEEVNLWPDAYTQVPILVKALSKLNKMRSGK